jgi:pilus assembly protein CpaF
MSGRTVVHAPADAWAAARAAPAARVDLLTRVRTRLVEEGGRPDAAAVASAVRAEDRLLADAEVLELAAVLGAEIHGLGALEPLLLDTDVTDILVNRPDDVWVDRGAGLERVPVSMGDEASVRALAQRLAARCGRRLDDAAPWVDARLPDGTRVHAVLAPVAVGGAVLSIRVPRRRAFTLEDLVQRGSMPPDGAAWLRALVGARLAFVLTGGTGTGKTTVLSTLLGEVDHGDRIVIVEDAAELRPDHPHVVRLESRTANVEGAGEVSLRDLVRQALRMRPDRLVVGEARGAEVVDLLGALNTGHEGGCATLHANTAADVPARLEALGLLAGIGRDAMQAQLFAALDVVVHLARGRDGVRRVAEIHVLDRARDGTVTTRAALTFARDGTIVAGPGEPALRRRIARA